MNSFELLPPTARAHRLDQQAIDTATPAGKLLFGGTGDFAELERSMIRAHRVSVSVVSKWASVPPPSSHYEISAIKPFNVLGKLGIRTW